MANIDSFSNPSTGIFHRIQSINLLIRRSALLFPFFSENNNSCEWKNAIKFVPCGVHFSICAPYTSWFVLGTLLDLCSWKLAHKHNQLINQIPNHVGDGWNEKKKQHYPILGHSKSTHLDDTPGLRSTREFATFRIFRWLIWIRIKYHREKGKGMGRIYPIVLLCGWMEKRWHGLETLYGGGYFWGNLER